MKNWLLAGPGDCWGLELNPAGGRSPAVSPVLRAGSVLFNTFITGLGEGIEGARSQVQMTPS